MYVYTIMQQHYYHTAMNNLFYKIKQFILPGLFTQTSVSEYIVYYSLYVYPDTCGGAVE
jgi:hypothetical protein